MKRNIRENIGASFQNALLYSKNIFVNCKYCEFTLMIFLLAPVIGWVFLAGYLIRVLRGGEAKLGGWKDMFLSGINACGIILAYMCIPIIVLFIFKDTNTVVTLIQSFFAMTPGEILAVLPQFLRDYIIYLFFVAVFALHMTLSLIQYARAGVFLSSFVPHEMHEAVDRMGGWYVYVLVWFCVAIPLTVITFSLMMVPVAGWIILLILAPFLLVMSAKFLTSILA